jgi:hypothetical protein
MRKLLVLTLWAWIAFSWQPTWGQSPGVRIDPTHKPKQQANLAGDNTQRPQIGTNSSPLVVETHARAESKEESAKTQNDKDHAASIERWTLIFTGGATFFTGFLVVIGWRGVVAANRTLRAIEKQAGLMETQIEDARKSGENSVRDVQASIAEAIRSAKAMEGVAESMAANASSVKESVRISQDIANMQELATTLHGRAYLSVFLNGAKFQDANHVFEVQAALRNHGNTPAYDVTFRAAVQIIDAPLREDFAFPLPDETAGPSVSLMAPGITKLITRSVLSKVPDEQVEAIKRALPPRCLAMWGVVKYRDAFKEARHLKFAFTVAWIPWVKGMEKDKDGNALAEQIMSYDTARHNDAD